MREQHGHEKVRTRHLDGVHSRRAFRAIAITIRDLKR